MRRQLVDPAILQHDQPVREFQRLPGVAVFVDVAIQVGAGQRQQQGTARKALGKGVDRSEAAPCMQRQHQVGRASIPFHLHPHRVARLAQEMRPACGGMPVAVAVFAAIRRDEGDAHRVSVACRMNRG